MSKKKKKNLKAAYELAEDLLHAVAAGGNFIKRPKAQPALPNGWTRDQLTELDQFLRCIYDDVDKATYKEKFLEYVNNFTYPQFHEGFMKGRGGFPF